MVRRQSIFRTMTTDCLKRYGGWIALAIFAALYYRSFGKGIDSVTLYAAAGRCIWHAQTLLPCVPMFSYQPALAAVFVPFAALPAVLQKPVWYLISIGSLMVTVRLAEAMAERLYPGATRGQNLIWLRTVSLFVCSKQILDTLNYEAYEAPALAIMTFGTWALTVGRDAWSGGALALAASVRATPLVYLPYLAIKRRALACAVFIVVLLALSFLPDLIGALKGGHTGYLGDWARQVAGPALAPGTEPRVAFWNNWYGLPLNNQSLRGLVNRFVTGADGGLSPKLILLAVDAAFAAVAGALLVFSPRQRKFAAIDGAVLLIAQLALSPMTSRYHFIFILPGVVLIAAAIIRDPRLRVFGSVVLAASFMLITGTSNDLAGGWLTELSYRYGFLIEGAILQFAAFAAMLWIWPPREQPDAALEQRTESVAG
jgi:hypothetical protein